MIAQFLLPLSLWRNSLYIGRSNATTLLEHTLSITEPLEHIRKFYFLSTS